MTSSRMLRIVLSSLFALAGLLLVPRTDFAQGAARIGPTPPRLRFIDGAVSFWRPGAEDWTEAQINTALAAGDSLYAGDGGNFELQIGPRALVRAGANTAVDLSSLESDYMQFRITGGHAVFDLKTLPRGQSIEVDSPNAAFTIDGPGYYRVDVDETKTAFSARRGGAATVSPATGQTTEVADNQQIILEGTDAVYVNVNRAPPLDEWDRWNDERMAQLGEAPRSAQYVPPDIAGADDLDRYGDWREQPRYGHIWVPRDVPRDWAPYSTGRWVYDPYYQWTWVDEAPWGWAPYHYGRWVYVGGSWGWAPGQVIAGPVYSPALVAFFGAPGLGVSVGIGLPFVSWVALGFGEPVIPWWGQRGFVGRPYWGGWGGPRVVNNVVINNTTIVNVRNVTEFQNVKVRNAVMGVGRNQFGRGRGEHIRLDPERVQRLRPVRGDLRVQPVAASLVPREVHGGRPPDRLQRRQVVATRPPPDPMRRLREKGVHIAAPARVPEARIVRPQHGPAGPGTPPQIGARPAYPGAAGAPDGKRQRAQQTGPPAQHPAPAPAAQHPDGVGAARPERRPRVAPPETRAHGASQPALSPPPPHAKPARVERASPSEPPQPVPGGKLRPGAVGDGRPERPPDVTSPQPGSRRASEGVVPPPHARRERVERTSPSEQAPARPAAHERSRGAPTREGSSAGDRPTRPDAPLRRQAAPHQPAVEHPGTVGRKAESAPKPDQEHEKPR
jgi:Family of unknown function (DUF6600)